VRMLSVLVELTSRWMAGDSFPSMSRKATSLLIPQNNLLGTWQSRRGNASDTKETATKVSAA
jgi:hypothetical protein